MSISLSADSRPAMCATQDCGPPAGGCGVVASAAAAGATAALCNRHLINLRSPVGRYLARLLWPRSAALRRRNDGDIVRSGAPFRPNGAGNDSLYVTNLSPHLVQRTRGAEQRSIRELLRRVAAAAARCRPQQPLKWQLHTAGTGGGEV